MASLIDANSIDDTYPIAGIDNDSQGFRDNFNIIKNNFNLAKSEISDLQTNTAKLNETNDFNGEIILNATMQQQTEETYNLGIQSGSVEVSWQYGSYQIVKLNGTIILNLTGWPETTKVGKMRVVVQGPETDDTYDYTFSAVNGAFLTEGSFVYTGTVSQNQLKIFDFWTTTGGAFVYAMSLGSFS